MVADKKDKDLASELADLRQAYMVERVPYHSYSSAAFEVLVKLGLQACKVHFQIQLLPLR